MGFSIFAAGLAGSRRNAMTLHGNGFPKWDEA
jgi:hypothetical protein